MNKTAETTCHCHRNQAGFATLAVLLLALVLALLFSATFEFQLLRLKQDQTWAQSLQTRAAIIPVNFTGKGK